jgi:DNA-binding NtrC family response regulator
MKSLSVLVADDEEHIRSLLVHWLIVAGHGATGVASATEARKLMGEQRFDLVVTDVLMPDGDGIQLIKEMKQAQPLARIVAVSGGGRYIEGDDCLKIARGLGAHVAVMKPFTCEQMLAGIQQALAPEPVSEA